MMDTSNAAVDAWLASSVIGGYDIPINTAYRGELSAVSDRGFGGDDRALRRRVSRNAARPATRSHEGPQAGRQRGPRERSSPQTAGLETYLLSELYAHGSKLSSTHRSERGGRALHLGHDRCLEGRHAQPGLLSGAGAVHRSDDALRTRGRAPQLLPALPPECSVHRPDPCDRRGSSVPARAQAEHQQILVELPRRRITAFNDPARC